MINIAKEEELVKYLREIDYKQDDDYEIRYCVGGISCTVVLLKSKQGSSTIIKQALAKLNTKETWLCSQDRMRIEYEANRIYHEVLPEYAPEVYFYDDKNYIYARRAVPDGCVTWKDELMQGVLDFDIAKQSVEALVHIHNLCSKRDDIKELFSNKDIFHSLRILPYIDATIAKYPNLVPYANFVKSELMNTSITLVHGDYSPKNIMIENRKIVILDYEVAHFGHPAFDLAFLSSHMVLKSIKFEQYGRSFIGMLEYMITLYFNQMEFMDKDTFEAIYIKILALLLLARIDGKSPVEYLTGYEEKKVRVRQFSMKLIEKEIVTVKGFISLYLEMIGKEDGIHERLYD